MPGRRLPPKLIQGQAGFGSAAHIANCPHRSIDLPAGASPAEADFGTNAAFMNHPG